MTPKEVALEFARRINSQNVDALCQLMTPDHKFVGSLGAVVDGRETMRNGWTGYFRMVPDYQISFNEIFEHGSTVAAFGKAGGTFAVNGKLAEENRWQVPAAWWISIQDNLVAEWRVYADNEPIRRLMSKQQE